MAWIISLLMLVFGCINKNYIFIVTSGLYAIAGCIGGAANILKGVLVKIAEAPKVEPGGMTETE